MNNVSGESIKGSLSCYEYSIAISMRGKSWSDNGLRKSSFFETLLGQHPVQPAT